MVTEEQLARIHLLALDVDGVLTDGSIIIGQEGELASILTPGRTGHQPGPAPWYPGGAHHRTPQRDRAPSGHGTGYQLRV